MPHRRPARSPLRPAFPQTTPQHLIGLIAAGIPARPRKFNPDIPADLETVVLKAAARDPAERYAGAAELADDLRRFLDDRPVTARRVGPLGQAWRWARRNRALAAALAVSFLLMVGITAVSLVAWYRTEAAHRETAEAKREVELEKAKVDEALAVATTQRDTTEQVSRLALGALNRMYERYAPTRLVVVLSPGAAGVELPPQPPALPPDALPVLDDLLRTYEEVARTGREFPRLRDRVAEAHHRIGDIRRRLGRFEEAAAAYREAIALYSALPPDAADDVSLRLARARNDLGRTLWNRHQFDEASAAHREVIRTLGEPPPGRPEVWYEVASAYQALGRRDMLVKAPGKGGPSGKNGPGGADDNPTRRAIELLEPLTSGEKPAPECLHLLARCYRDLGPGRPHGGSESNGARAVRLLRRLATEYPHVPDYRFDLCEALGGPGGPTGRPEDADADLRTWEWAREAIAVADGLVREYPSVPEYTLARARARDSLGMRLLRAGRAAEAVPLHRQAVADQEGLVKAYPGVVSNAVWLGMMERSLGDALAGRGELPEARTRLESATARVDARWRKEPRLAGLRPFLGMAYRDLAGVLDRLGEPAPAADAMRKAEEFGPDPRKR